MPAQTLYLDDDVLLKLKAEENMSRVVSKLLRDHYEKSKSIAQQKLEIAQLEIMAEAEEKAKKLKLEDFE